MATTPCPKCQAALVVRGERGVCATCGQAVRFVDAPDMACRSCAARVPLSPGQVAAKCTQCGAWNASDPTRPVQGRVVCPRCRRVLVAPLDTDALECPHCKSSLALRDTL